MKKEPKNFCSEGYKWFGLLGVAVFNALRRASAAFLLLLGAAAPDDELSSLLKAQTQAFSDAGQLGDAATIGLLLDHQVVFTNEAGEIGTRQDIIDSTSPPPAGGPVRHVQIIDWAMHRQGDDLATATFIDQVSAAVGGQSLVLKFQSTETWIKRADGWKMLVSQTMNVEQTPAGVALAPATLDQYVGTYRLGAVYIVRIVRNGLDLTASVNGAAPVVLKAEAKDVLFSPGALTVRRLFQRDAAGRVLGYINRRNGADLVFTKQVEGEHG